MLALTVLISFVGALVLMLLGDAGRVALPQIQQCWVSGDGKANLFSLLAYIVRSANDSQIVVQEIDRTRSKLGVKETWETALASASQTPAEVLAQVRTGWTNASRGIAGNSPQCKEQIYRSKKANDIVPKRLIIFARQNTAVQM